VFILPSVKRVYIVFPAVLVILKQDKNSLRDSYYIKNQLGKQTYFVEMFVFVFKDIEVNYFLSTCVYRLLCVCNFFKNF